METSEVRQQGASRSKPPPRGASSVVGGDSSPRSSSGRVLVERTAQSLCGAGAVGSSAAAEGLALSRLRAASLFDPVSPHGLGKVAPWVLHRTTQQRAEAAPFGAFELAAATGQEAVDHCLVAHLIGTAGECLIDETFLARPWLYEPLRAEAAETALTAGATGSSNVADAFARATRATGRDVLPVRCHRTTDADVVFVATGQTRELALEAADALRHAKVACGVVGVALLRPFPAAELAAVLQGKRRIIVAEPAWTAGRLMAEVSAALHADDGVSSELCALDLQDPSSWSALSAMAGTSVEPLDHSARPALVLAALPASGRSQELLFEVVSRLAGVAPFELWRPETRLESSIAVGGAPRRVQSVDVLFVAHPALLDTLALGGVLSDGATVAIPHLAGKPDSVWSELSPLQHEFIAQKQLRLVALDSTSASWDALVAAVASATKAALVTRLGWAKAALDALIEPSSAVTEISAARAPALSPSRPERAELPRLPEPPAQPDPPWLAAVRHFHLSGVAGDAALLPLAPLAVSALLRSRGAASAFPLLVDGGRAQSLHESLRVALEAAQQAGTSAAVTLEHLPRLVAQAAQVSSESLSAQPAAVVLPQALARFGAEFRLSDAARKSFELELSQVRAALPSEGRVLGLSEHAHLELYAEVVLGARRKRSIALAEQVRSLAERLRELLRLDDTRSSDGATAPGLGEGGALFDAARLARVVPAQRGPQRLGAERRARLEALVGTLAGFLSDAQSEPELLVVHSTPMAAEPALGRARLVQHEDCFGVAAGLFDGVAQQRSAVFAAVRAAKRELGEAPTEPSFTDGKLDWQGFSREELMLVPPILVVERAERVWEASLDSLSKLLRSGRPVHVIIEDRATVGASPPGLGYVLSAHHEAFVTQSTLAAPDHLAHGFERMAGALRPAVAVLLPRPARGPMPSWLELAATHEGRALPCFRYDPGAGSSWADCFDVEGNPHPERLWPSHAAEVVGPDGAATALPLDFTYADAVALDLTQRRHFWVIPSSAWSDEQVELARYVDALSHELPRQVPFIWVVSDSGELARAIVSRELAFECRQRRRVWRMLQELGGANNEHARRAVEAARRVAQDEAAEARAALERAHAAELDRVRTEEASEALGRLARALLDPGALLTSPPIAPRDTPAAPAATSTLADSAAAPTAAPAVASAAEEAEEEAVNFSEPFIDTPLCTTCNECTNLNPLMFKYNADKQAFIADVLAGTFLQLVVAAEKCPATCIHPGAPREGDATVTDDLLARAARFN